MLEAKAVLGGSGLCESRGRGSLNFGNRITSVLSPKILDLDRDRTRTVRDQILDLGDRTRTFRDQILDMGDRSRTFREP